MRGLPVNMPGEVGQAACELGEVRLRRGDLKGAAAAFRRAIEVGAEPQPGLALLRLAEGKPGVGLGELTRALADVPEDRMERARLLPAVVELAVAAGQTTAAREALEELVALATLYRSDALTATSCWARGIVALADGDPASAATSLRDAMRRWHALEAPYEAARARTALGEAYQATGDGDSAALELEAAHAIFERLGAVAAARRAEELLRRGRGGTVTATFLFSDICGSTNLVEAIGDTAWLDLVQWHDRTLRALFDEHGGTEVDHAGDGFFVAFAEPRAAVDCAIAIQQALAEQRRDHGFAPPVRVGLHTADAIQAGRDYRGKGIHTAARIGGVATANEVVASRETAEAARFGFDNPRTLELKGLSAPVEVVTIDWG